MAGRDGAITVKPVMIYFPMELIVLVKYYQNARRIQSFSGTIKELLETHPGLVALASEIMYPENSQQDNPERTPA